MFGFGKKTAINTLSPDEAHRRVAAGTLRLVDVREPNEWSERRIPGAVHAPLSRLADTAASLPKDKPIAFYCLSGNRSARAVDLCRRLGLPHDTHVHGGISAWAAAGLPVQR